MSGWISIHRKIQEHWLWLSEKPFDKRSAWIDILLMVNHEDKKILLGNELIEVKRGSRVTSIRQLCDRWGWSNTKVKNFLNLLEKDDMLVVKSDSKKTTLTVVNYSDYQDSNDSKNDRQATDERQASDAKTTRKHTNNNDNNDNNDNNIYILTQDEEKFLSVLNQVENYPLDREKDLKMYHALAKRYPKLNLLEAIEQWRVYKLDKPLTEKSNPRSQINMAFKKYLEWGKCLKGEKKNERNTTRREHNAGSDQESLTGRETFKDSKIFRKKLG